MKRQYNVSYKKKNEEVIDIFNNIEMMLFTIISIFDKNIKNIEIIENDFLESS